MYSIFLLFLKRVLKYLEEMFNWYFMDNDIIRRFKSYTLTQYVLNYKEDLMQCFIKQAIYTPLLYDGDRGITVHTPWCMFEYHLDVYTSSSFLKMK